MYLFSKMRPLEAHIHSSVYTPATTSSFICILRARACRRAQARRSSRQPRGSCACGGARRERVRRRGPRTRGDRKCALESVALRAAGARRHGARAVRPGPGRPAQLARATLRGAPNSAPRSLGGSLGPGSDRQGRNQLVPSTRSGSRRRLPRRGPAPRYALWTGATLPARRQIRDWASGAASGGRTPVVQSCTALLSAS